MGEINFSLTNTKFISIESLIVKVQKLEGKTKMTHLPDFSNYKDEMKYLRQTGSFHFEEDILAKI